eukprot:m.82666 g.82666  ORF g.82666 m.82666 type:complete len:64 (+) comp25539_c0_seq2:148-339(+)
MKKKEKEMEKRNHFSYRGTKYMTPIQNEYHHQQPKKHNKTNTILATREKQNTFGQHFTNLNVK